MNTPNFPHIYLAKEVSPRTAAMKKRLGLCKHWGCANPRREGRYDCHKCHIRKWRMKNAQKYAYHMVKDSAQKRDIEFNLTFKQFCEFDRQHNYVARKGRGSGQMSLDRIDPSRGYKVGNLRVIPTGINASRKWDNKPFDDSGV